MFPNSPRATYFISDLHLHEHTSESQKILLSFLDKLCDHADALYILGDFFELWLGQYQPATTPFLQAIQQSFKKLHQHNVAIFFMPGNRDFLITQHELETLHCQLLPDPCVITLYQKQWILSHGDQLCAADKGYQWFRSFVQCPWIKKGFSALPLMLRCHLGRWLQSQTKQRSRKKYLSHPEFCTITETTVQQWMQKYQAHTLIHGHTHKPYVHHYPDYHPNAKRIVLGDWTQQQAKILKIDTNCDFELLDLVRG